MAIPALRLPDHPRPSSYEITKLSNVLSSAPIVGAHRTQTRLIGEDYHTVSLSYNPMSRDEYAPLISFINSLQGPHTQFAVTIPNFSRSSNVLEAGNYVSLSNGRCVQIMDASGFTPSNLVTGTTKPNSFETFSNIISVTAGVPVGIYLNAADVAAEGTISLRATNAAGGGSLLSEEQVDLSNGRNFVVLTPTATQGLYVRATHPATTTITAMSVHTGLSAASATLSPALTPADAGAYLVPGEAAVMPCSLTESGVTVTYGSDSFISVRLDLIERQL